MAEINIEALKKAMREHGLDPDSEGFVMALRKAENPGGCEWCGARTKMAVEGPKKTLVLACCKRKVA